MLIWCPACLADSESVYSDRTPILGRFGDHALHCKDSNALQAAPWHDSAVQQFLLSTRLAQVPGTAEPVNAMLTSNKRPDVTVAQSGCKRVFAGATAYSATLKRSCCGAATTPGHAADQGQLDKEGDWPALAEAEGGISLLCPLSAAAAWATRPWPSSVVFPSPMVRVTPPEELRGFND